MYLIEVQPRTGDQFIPIALVDTVDGQSAMVYADHGLASFTYARRVRELTSQVVAELAPNGCSVCAGGDALIPCSHGFRTIHLYG